MSGSEDIFRESDALRKKLTFVALLIVTALRLFWLEVIPVQADDEADDDLQTVTFLLNVLMEVAGELDT